MPITDRRELQGHSQGRRYRRLSLEHEHATTRGVYLKQSKTSLEGFCCDYNRAGLLSTMKATHARVERVAQFPRPN
jgi:hypothetical protein